MDIKIQLKICKVNFKNLITFKIYKIVRSKRTYLLIFIFGASFLPFFLLQCKTNSHQISVLGKFENPADNPLTKEKIAAIKAKKKAQTKK